MIVHPRLNYGKCNSIVTNLSESLAGVVTTRAQES